jgi:succinate dehydrogenase / fumarate reductase flavoprotein subunit
MAQLDSHIPSGPLALKWTRHKDASKLINPANKRKYEIIVVGAGLAGGPRPRPRWASWGTG